MASPRGRQSLRPGKRRSRQARTVPSSDLLATLSHQLRGSLNVIMGWAHLLRDPRLDRKNVIQGAEIICQNVEIQSRLISDLLDAPQKSADAAPAKKSAQARDGRRPR